MAKYVNGTEGVVSFYDDTADAWKPIGCETSHTLEENQDIDTADGNKCEPTPPKSQGDYSYTLSIDAQLISTDHEDYSDKANYEWLRDLFKTSRDEKEPVEWRLSDKNGDEYGEAYITSLSKTGTHGEVATFSVSLEGVGEISETDPH